MVDTKSTFDAAVIRYARDEDQTQAILESRLYRNLRDASSGTQEYMAVEKLCGEGSMRPVVWTIRKEAIFFKRRKRRIVLARKGCD